MAARFDISQKCDTLRYVNEKFGFSKHLCASSSEHVKQKNKCTRRISLVRIALVVTTKTTSNVFSLQDMKHAFLILYFLLSMRVDDHFATESPVPKTSQLIKKMKNDGYCGHLECPRGLHFYRKT